MNEAPEMEMKQEDWGKQSIYKLTPSITNRNKEAYIPQYVSFGPYHHGKEHLLPMEKHKERALHRFLKRSRKTQGLLIDFLANKVKDFKSSYADLPKEWEDDNKFMWLMILDGCFMLEILLGYRNPESLLGYAENDPIFSDPGMMRLRSDMVIDMSMLENQLPMLVLENLLAFVPFGSTEQKDVEFLNNLILVFICPACLTVEHVGLGKCLHVLDVLRKYLLRGDHQALRGDHQASGKESDLNVIIPSATELNLAGFRFGKSEILCLEDISFDGRTLNLPQIVVADGTKSLFLNLMAFERCHIGTGNTDISSYIYFMDYIIVTEKDVALLKSEGIVKHLMGSDKEVVEVFKSLAPATVPDPNWKLNAVQDKIKEDYDQPLIAWRTNLSRTVESFRNRWAFLSLVAAICLFALAITQTVYSALSYHRNNSPPTPPPPAVPPPPPPMIPSHR